MDGSLVIVLLLLSVCLPVSIPQALCRNTNTRSIDFSLNYMSVYATHPLFTVPGQGESKPRWLSMRDGTPDSNQKGKEGAP